MKDRKALQAIEKANEAPLNQAAKKLLQSADPKWASESHLHVLNLMRWGVEEAGISLPKADNDALEEMLNRLDRATPESAMQLLTNPEANPGQTNLAQADLEKESARGAAEILLTTLAQSTQANAL